MTKWALRALAAFAGTGAALALAGAAFAHVEVEAEPAVAGSANAVITFSAEAESDSAGITSVRIVLPAGIAPADVTLAKAPSGWRLAPGTDGYTVAGTALKTGADAVHSITVAALPSATTLVFKALVTYSDGSVDRWIEEPTSSGAEPDNPAPVLTLSPAPKPSATPAAVVTSAPAPVATETTAPAASATTDDSDGVSPLWWVGLGLIVVLAAGAIIVLRRR